MGLEEFLKPSLLQKQKRRDKRLHEEVIEVGRVHGGQNMKIVREKGYKRFYAKNFPESFPVNISIAPLGSTTYFDDKLGLLKKFLMSHVGQKWDIVFSKMNAVLDNRSLQGIHIVGHIWDFVERHVDMRDGKVVRKVDKRWLGSETCSHWRLFYVHPETGILCRWCEAHRQKPAKKARFKKEKEKLKWKTKTEQKMDKTPPKTLEKRENTVHRTPSGEGGVKQKSIHYFSKAYDETFENYWLDEWAKAEELEKNAKVEPQSCRGSTSFFR